MKPNQFMCAIIGALLLFAAHAFAALPGTAFVETQTITVPNARPLEDFGNALDVSNGLLIGGAINSIDSSGLETGGAYVYRRSSGGFWDQIAKLTPLGGQYDEEFGYSVGIDGDFALVGARTHTEASFGQGAVYFYHRVADFQWQQIGSFFPPAGSYNLGIYADLHGPQAAVAGTRSVAPGVGGTRAFVNIYEQVDQKSWLQTQRLEIGTQLSFVNDVAINNGTLALGTSRRSSQSQPSTYQVELFQRSATGFVPTATITAPSGQVGSWFGVQLALDNDRLLVGDPKEGTQGAAYIYERGANGTWTQSARLIPPDPNETYFGSEVAVAGNLAVVEGRGGTNSLNDHSVYVLERDGAGNWNDVANLVSFQSQGNFGYQLGANNDQVFVNSGLNAPGAVHVFSEVPEPGTFTLAAFALFALAARNHYGL